jgi:uncharacterized protein
MLTEEYVRESFAPLETGKASFLAYLSENITWTLTGKLTPLSGTYTSKPEVITKILGPVSARMATPLAFKVTSVLVAGDWGIVEFTGSGTTKGGNEYIQDLCWICRYQGGFIVEVREYLDSALLKALFDEE